MEALVDYEKLIAGKFMDEKTIYSRDKKNNLAVEKNSQVSTATRQYQNFFMGYNYQISVQGRDNSTS